MESDVREDGLQSVGGECVAAVRFAPNRLPFDGQGGGCSVAQSEDVPLSRSECRVDSPQHFSISRVGASPHSYVVDCAWSETFEFHGRSRHLHRVVLLLAKFARVRIEWSYRYSEKQFTLLR